MTVGVGRQRAVDQYCTDADQISSLATYNRRPGNAGCRRYPSSIGYPLVSAHCLSGRGPVLRIANFPLGELQRSWPCGVPRISPGRVWHHVRFFDRLQRSRSWACVCRPTGAQETVSISGIGYRAFASSFLTIKQTSRPRPALHQQREERNHVTGYFDFYHQTKRGRRADGRRIKPTRRRSKRHLRKVCTSGWAASSPSRQSWIISATPS
jgi:hypothetical protein